MDYSMKNTNGGIPLVSTDVPQLSPAEVQKTLDMVDNQVSSQPLKVNVHSIAHNREQVHISGTSNLKVKKVRRAYDKKITSSKKLSKDEIQERKINKQTFKGFSLLHAFGSSYEGFFDAKFTMSVEDATTENVRILMDQVMNKVKETINSSKVSVEHILKMDAEILHKTLISLAFMICGICFYTCFDSASLFTKFVFVTVTALAATYPFLKDIRDYMLKQASVAIVGVDIFRHINNHEEVSDEDLEAFRQYAYGLKTSDERRAEEAGPSFVDIISSSVRETFPIRYQSGFGSAAPILHMLCEFVASTAGIITGFCYTGDMSKLVRNITNSARTRSDLQCIINEALRWILSFVDTICGTTFKDMCSQNADLQNWGDAVSSMYSEYTLGTLKVTPYESKRVGMLTIRGTEIASKRMEMPAGAWAYHRFCMGMLTKMASTLSNAGISDTERQQPLAVCLMGASGSGKSHSQGPLIDNLAMKVLKGDRLESYRKNPTSEQWSFNVEEDHANGYNGQFAVIIDDMGQFMTQKGQRDDMSQIIRFCNVAPCRMNAAELEKKGSLVFNSELIVCSTNLYQFWSPSILLPEAFIRRFDLWVEVVPKVAYSKDETAHGDPRSRRLDARKCIGAFDDNACEYKIMKVTCPIQQTFALDRIVSYDELCDILHEKYTVHYNNFKKLHDENKARREAVLAQWQSKNGAEYEGFFGDLCGWFSSTRKIAKSAYDSVRDKFIEETRKICVHSFVKSNKLFFTALAAILAALIGLFLVFNIGKYFLKTSTQVRNPLHVDYEAELLDGKARPTLYSNQLIAGILRSSVYHMYREETDYTRNESVGTITMISGHFGIMNAHYLPQLRNALERGTDKNIRLVRHTPYATGTILLPIGVFLEEDEVFVDEDSDLCMIRFPKSVPAAKDIIKHFCTDEAYQQNRDFNTVLVAARSPNTVCLYQVKDSVLDAPLSVCGNTHTGVVIYNADTHVGDCGSLLCYSGNFPNNIERIVGIHMAGTTSKAPKQAYATIVNQAKLKHMMSWFEKEPTLEYTVVPEGTFMSQETCHVLVDDKAKTVFAPVRSSIEKSALYGCLHPVVKAPARLAPFTAKDGTWIKPLKKAHEKQISTNIHVDVKELDCVSRDVLLNLQKSMKHGGTKLSFDEAIIGKPELQCLGPIPRNTSAGYTYYNDPRVKNGKKEFFGPDTDYVLSGPLYDDLKVRVEALECKMRQGIVPEERVYMDILKDETLPLAKVEIGKTRMISACDLPMTVLYRKYFGVVCNDLVQNRIVNGIAVGINPYSDEWAILVRYLKNKGGNLIAGDFSSYDNSQTCQLIEAVVWIMSELTGLKSAEDKMVMKCLSITLSQPYHVSGNKIYYLDHGMPSGNPMTSIMNSIFGLVAFRLVWGDIMRDQYPHYHLCIADFTENVSIVMYGDDNALGIKKEVIEKFNQTSLMKCFPKYGLKYTSDDKEDENPLPWRKIEEITFLKRSFVWNKLLNRHVAALDIPTIFSMLHYTKRGGSSDSITIDNCKNAIREASLHGQIFYEDLVTRLVPLVKERLGVSLGIPNYQESLLEASGYKPTWIKEHI